jgi:sporulation protein YlmC with PRC-barrel domain
MQSGGEPMVATSRMSSFSGTNPERGAFFGHPQQKEALMKRILLTTACALVGFTGAALAQTSTSSPAATPPATTGTPGSQSGTTGTQSGATGTQSGTTGTQSGTTGTQSDTTGTQSGTGMQSSRPGIQRLDGASAVMTLYTANPADVRASKLMGTNVYNLKDENIGEVSDLVIDNGKTITAVVVSVGGFLGIGERNVAISPASVVLNEQRDGSFRLVVNTTKDDLKNAAPFNFADVDKAGPNAGKAADARSMKSEKK